MKFKDFVKNVSERTGVSIAKAEAVINIAFDEIAELLKKEDEIVIRNFGKFETYKSKETTGINVYTQQKIKIPSRNRPRFKASLTLRKYCDK